MSTESEFDPYPSLYAAETGGGLQAYLNADARSGTADNGKISFTIDQAASRLTGDEAGWGGVLGQPATVTYAFRATEPATMPSDTGGFSAFNAAQINQTELALKAWSDVANITFVRVGSGTTGDLAYSNNASILFGNYSTGEDGSSAFGYYPGSRSAASSAGDVWVNSTLSYNAAPNVGNYGGQVLVHEIGHTIGLQHPSDYNASATSSFTYAADASYYEDSRQYTVMSYFGGYNTGADLPGYSAAPLLDDIAAAQEEYGANMTTRTGDTVYGFNSNTDRPWYTLITSSSQAQFAVWDAGGNDTLDFSGYANRQTIDLRPGFFSDVGGWTGNVIIAKGADIENAIGGTGADSITGNALNNRLQGNGGNDTIMAGAGDDTITDTSGSNYLRGEDGNDSMQGGSGFDDMNGNMGADTLHGGGGDDWVVGGKDADALYGDAGNDLIYGNMGDDYCFGNDGNDTIRGGQGNDVVNGDDGNDWLSGDLGNDTLTGGAGADTFHASAGGGVDKVMDFSQAEGDRIQLDPGQAYTVSQVGADTVVDLGDGSQMILVGVKLSTLSSGWIFNG